ncbi:helix-turn-helix domain-containing protein [Actinokineospora pegani]|uniref:helix-turn-helix domain-containing protein n=1 Tax=Actinokineospora pegani TaxID=2654637 RepID=UPI001F34D561|nr:helix-turn-helix domain-containing protein [Actinokineospora pegani]
MHSEQIIEAARVLFVQVGAHVPMEEIARAAGVGVGTLYRRFPDRDELVRAVSPDVEIGAMAPRRVFALVVAGLRTETGAPLPGRPVDHRDIEEPRARGGLIRVEQPGESEQGPLKHPRNPCAPATPDPRIQAALSLTAYTTVRRGRRRDAATERLGLPLRRGAHKAPGGLIDAATVAA